MKQVIYPCHCLEELQNELRSLFRSLKLASSPIIMDEGILGLRNEIRSLFRSLKLASSPIIMDEGILGLRNEVRNLLKSLSKVPKT